MKEEDGGFGKTEIRWSEEKNKLIREKHGISFEEVEKALKDEKLIVLDHPNQNKYP